MIKILIIYQTFLTLLYNQPPSDHCNLLQLFFAFILLLQIIISKKKCIVSSLLQRALIENQRSHMKRMDCTGNIISLIFVVGMTKYIYWQEQQCWRQLQSGRVDWQQHCFEGAPKLSPEKWRNRWRRSWLGTQLGTAPQLWKLRPLKICQNIIK